MAADTSIEWADKTWSPIIGCDRVSPGCDRCYAITTARIREGHPHPGVAAAFAGTTTRTDAGIDWSGKINLLEDRLTQPFSWKKPAKVFVNSMSDLFHKDVPDAFIARVFAVMARTPQHTFQILTKRHGRMRSLLGGDHAAGLQRLLEASSDEDTARALYDAPWPLPNVWLGVSVENQQWADLRIPALLETPAAVRFLSCEPLLGPIDLQRWLPAEQVNSLRSLVPLDDQVRGQCGEQRDHVGCAADGPVAHRLPAVALDAGVVPSNASAQGGLEPGDDLRRSAVDGHSGAAASCGTPAPVDVPFAIEHPSDVAEGPWIGGHANALRGSPPALPTERHASCLQTPPDGRSASTQPIGELLNSLPAGVGGGDLVGRECDCGRLHAPHSPTIDWVIVGGESGSSARPMHPDWARSLRDQCAQAGVPFFFKQFGEWGPAQYRVPVCDPKLGWQGTDEELAAAKGNSEARGATHVHTGNWWMDGGERRYEIHEIGHKPWSLERVGLPDGAAAIRRWGRKRAGRELDGRTHDDYPTTP